jgi:hypothetical protein
MARTLASIALKIERAEEHLRDLQTRGEAWAKAQPVQIIHEHDTQTGWHKLRAQPLPDPPGQWVVIFGEFGYQLRSALNFAVEGLVLANHQLPSKSNQFPIYSDRKPAIDDAGMKRCLVGVAADPARIIDAIQPYHRPDRLDLDALEVVALSANRDKHHDLHVSGVVLLPAGWQIDFGETAAVAEVGMIHAVQPIGDAQIAALRVIPAEKPFPNMKLDRAPTVDVAFSNGHSVPLGRLPAIVLAVKGVVDLLRPFLT